MRRSVFEPYLVALTGLSLLAGCPDRSISEVTPAQGGATTKEIPVSEDIDILFVIDDSLSTADKQTVFGNNFPKFVDALDMFPSGRPNLHMGVVTSTVDLGVSEGGTCPSPNTTTNGLLQNTPKLPGCTAITGQYISDVKDPNGSDRTTNYAGDLGSAFACIAEVGDGGCGFEAPLEGMKRALDGSKTQNTGFVRTGAYLAIVFLTDEDDASLVSGSNDTGGSGSAIFGLAPQPIKEDYRAQPEFAYQCDQALPPDAPTTANVTLTNCVPRTGSYLQDPGYYSSFLAGVKDPARTVVAVIAGPPPPPFATNDAMPQTAGTGPGTFAQVTIGNLTQLSAPQNPALMASCAATINGNPAIGRPAVRLASFLSNYGDRGRFYSVCQGDYSAALADIGAALFNAISPCIEGPLDTRDADPNNPGTQLQCTVSDVLNQGGSDQTSKTIPPCQMSNSTNTAISPPCNTAPCPTAGATYPDGVCWWADQDATSCPAPDTGWELNFVRAQPPVAGTTVDVQCAVVSTGSD